MNNEGECIMNDTKYETPKMAVINIAGEDVVRTSSLDVKGENNSLTTNDWSTIW